MEMQHYVDVSDSDLICSYLLQCIWYLVSYALTCHYGKLILPTIIKPTIIVLDDKWVHLLAKTLCSLVNNLWWNIVMDDWNLDEKNHLVSESNCNTLNV